MWRKIGLGLCLLLLVAAVAGSPQAGYAKDKKQTRQQQAKQTQSFKEKCEQKVKQIKAKVQKRLEQKTRNTAVLATRG